MRVGANQFPWAVATAAAVLAAALAACGSDKKEEKPEIPPTRLVATLTASSDVNPNIAGSPSPIFVRLYELKANTAFVTAGFFALWDEEDKALGKDLESRQQVVLSPGQQAKVEREFADGSAFLGVAAAYQDVQNAIWRAIQPIPAHETTTIQIDVGRTAVVLTVKKPEKPAKPDKPAKKQGEK